MTRSRRQGFIALMSAIIIATILLLVAVTGGLTGIFARGDALDAELKERSRAAADACAEVARLALADDPSQTSIPSPGLNGLDTCRIGTVAPATCSGQSAYEFHIQAVSSNAAVTDLDICLAAADLSVLSWREIPTF